MGLFPGRSEAVVGGIMTTVMVPTAEASTGSIHSQTVHEGMFCTVLPNSDRFTKFKNCWLSDTFFFRVFRRFC